MFKMMQKGYVPNNDLIKECIKKVSTESILDRIQNNIDMLDDQKNNSV